MEDFLLFHEVTEKYGGVFFPQNTDHKEFKERWNEYILHEMQSHVLCGPFPKKIIIDFFNNDSFRAFTTYKKGCYIIAISDAVLKISLYIFYKLLSNPKVLVNVGDVSKEIDINRITDYYFSLSDIVELGHKGIMEYTIPKDSIRKEYAENLARIAIDYIFFHELSHIQYGHVDYITSLSKTKNNLQFDSDNCRSKLLFDKQTLEYDADAAALGRCLDRMLTYFEKSELLPKPLKHCYKSKYKSSADIYFAIGTIFRLKGVGDYTDTTLGKYTHPNNVIRCLLIGKTFEAILKYWKQNLDWKKLNDHLVKAHLEKDLAYSIVTGNQIQSDLYDIKHFGKHPMTSAILKNWKESLRKKLLPYSYKKLPD